MTGSTRFLLPLAFASLCATAASADSPALIGSYKDWSAFQTTTNGTRVCYAMAKPKSMEPKKATRDPVYFLISDWPNRKARAELEIVPGYQYKDGSPVTAEIGKEKTAFFAKNDGGAGSAWVDDVGTEQKLVSAMEHGAKLVVTGVSQRGTTTHDTYALGGLAEALEKVHAACGM
jgi:Invasion associated locus B (IalB) protein